jgi:hypothetical protein
MQAKYKNDLPNRTLKKIWIKATNIPNGIYLNHINVERRGDDVTTAKWKELEINIGKGGKNINIREFIRNMKGLPIQCFTGIAPVVTLHYITLHCIALHCIPCIFWLLTSSSFSRRDGICSVKCDFPVSCFIIFQVFYLITWFCYKPIVMLPFSLFYNSVQDSVILNITCWHVWIITTPATYIHIYIHTQTPCKIFLFLV